MFMRLKWGNPLLVFTIGLCVCLDAHSQLVGGSSTAVGFNPSQVNMSPTAFAFGQDPMAGQSFNACMAYANALASVSNLPDVNSITPDNAVSAGVATTAGILGGALGGAAVGSANGTGIWNGIGSGGLAGGTGNVCSGPLPSPKFGESCEAFKVGDSFSAVKLDAAILSVSQAGQAAGCKAANAAKAQAILGCFSDEFQNLKDNMQSVKKDFDGNIQAMNQYEGTVKAEIQKEQSTQETLGGKIQTLGETKGKIEAILKQVNGSSGSAKGGGSSETVAGLQIQVNTLNDTLTAVKKHQKAALASGTAACLQGQGASASGIHNCPNAAGDLLPPKDCVLSIYRDGIALQFSGGSNRVSPADRHKAELAKTRFASRLDQMLSDFNGANPRIPDAAAFRATYGSELNAFGPAGVQMLSELDSCGTQAQTDIASQLSNPESQLGGEAVAAKNTSQELSSNIGGMINTLDTAMRDAGKEVYGQELNGLVNGFGCSNAAVSANQSAGGDTSAQPVALATQMKCVKSLNANLSAMLNGTPPPGASAPISVPLNVPGQDGSPARCAGLRDCLDKATKLQATSKQREKSLSGEGTFTDSRCPGGCPGLKKFRTDSNNNIQAALQQSADLFKRRVDIAKAQFAQVKSLLGGVDLQFPTKTAKGQKLDDVCPKSSDQICQMPADFGEKLAGLSGVPDIGPGDFDTSKKEAADKKGDFATKQTDFKNQAVSLGALRASCTKAAAHKTLEKKIAKVQDEFASRLAKCKSNAEGLDSTASQDFGSQIENLQTDLTKVCANAEPDNNDCRKLRTDIQTAQSDCRKVYDRMRKQDNKDIVDKCRAIVGASGDIGNCVAAGSKESAQ